MNSKRTLRAYLLNCVSVLILCSPISVEAEKQGLESGDWSGITWSPAGKPGFGDFVCIGGGIEVDYSDPGVTRVGRIYVGSLVDGSISAGTLTISNGILQTASNGSLAIQVAEANASNGMLRVTGGELLADGGGWITVGGGAESEGVVQLTEGIIRTDNKSLTLGSGDGSLGVLNMSGGQLEVADKLFVGRTYRSANRGLFNQSGGVASVGGPLRIGNATAMGHEPSGVVTLSGGRTTIGGSISIGNTVAGQLGEGTLSVGAGANLSITAKDSTLIVGDAGVLELVLGSDVAFQPVDLSEVDAAVALSFLENSRIVIDGSAFEGATENQIPLISYSRGHGPSGNSQANVAHHFVGFDSDWSPHLVWADDGLLLRITRSDGT